MIPKMTVWYASVLCGCCHVTACRVHKTSSLDILNPFVPLPNNDTRLVSGGLVPMGISTGEAICGVARVSVLLDYFLALSFPSG